jgi:hypothetical protein
MACRRQAGDARGVITLGVNLMSSHAGAVRSLAVSHERNFYVGMAIACALLVFIGFSPTYFLSPFFEVPGREGPWSPYLHLHGAVFTAWLALFVVQTCLIRADRRSLHMRLGILALVLAAAMIVLTGLTVVDAINDGRTSPVGPPIPRLWIAISGALIAAGFIFAGMYWRRNADTHKRLMLIATITMVSPAMNRLWGHLDLGALLPMSRATFSFAVIVTLICVCVCNDLWRRGRVHSAYAAGLVVVVGSRAVSPVVTESALWHAIASWVLS